jgi:hypothetical protein
MSIRLICALLFFTMIWSGPAYSQGEQEQGARGIFQLEQGNGFAIDILLKRPASDVWLNVPPDTVFRNGDQVKLGLRGNFDGYIYIINIGTSGLRRIMVPGPSVSENHLQKNLYKQFLVGELSGEPGEETLYIISAPTKIMEFEQAIAQNKGVIAAPMPETKTKTKPVAQPITEPPLTTKKDSATVINQPVSTKNSSKKSTFGVLKSVGANAVKILGIVSLFSREVESEYSPEDERTFVASSNGRLKGGEFVAFELILRHEK